ncbi:hypothetical protein [Acidisphaera sp. L21]|uniref:hypothetical protein n=1 Tax=Acidisphaera sp. L21 TaxID=1641851 RepID=UPI001C2037AB|nr:hypothetical protein [Acidisphaera sp. L21]
MAIGRVLVKEMRGHQITVNAIAPCPTATKLFLDEKPQELIDRLARPRRWIAWVSRRTSPPPYRS